MKKTTFCVLSLLLSVICVAQEEKDSLKVLQEVRIKAFEQSRPASSVVGISIIDPAVVRHFSKSSLVSSMNTIAGVRMEERSPGSYRLSIRGSSLRSPFGVRNIKVYWNNIPVTDPGGNIYFNQFVPNNFSYAELFKGPAGSMYGAGTGGLLLLENFDRWQTGSSIEYTGSSYNTHTILASARFGSEEHRNQFTFGHNESDGYRIQTKMRRDNFSWSSQMSVSEKQRITASVLFTDLYYQTPGALTLAEFNANPKAARPAGGGFPSAVAINASIRQKNILAGFSNEYFISPAFTNTTTLYGAFAQIKNSAIRNYERRNEPHFGGRTVFNWKRSNPNTDWQLVWGGEFQQGYFNTMVSNNRNGNPDTVQTNDDVNNTAYNVFVQADIAIQKKWFITGGVSLNKSLISIKRLSRYPVTKQSRTYKNEFAPRLVITREFGKDLVWQATVSKGFSPPSVGEVLPSTGMISTNLEAEEGWNYETTVRYFLFKRTLKLEATAFYFKLKNALVQRRDISGADFFINSGDIRQKGIEFHTDYSHSFRNTFMEYITIRADVALNHFRYGTFVKGTDTFSTKKVPSVPSTTFSGLVDWQLKKGFYITATFYSASKIYLNDANTAVADAYQLLGCQLGWRKTWKEKYRLNLFAGADNLLDEKYSLGNDINAPGNRFYNAAPRRNYYAGIGLQFVGRKRS